MYPKPLQVWPSECVHGFLWKTEGSKSRQDRQPDCCPTVVKVYSKRLAEGDRESGSMHTHAHTQSYMNTHVCIHTCSSTHTCTYTHTNTHMHEYTHMHIGMHMHIHSCSSAHTQTHTDTHMHTYTHAHVYTHVWTHTCTHSPVQAHVHTDSLSHTHTHTYTHTRASRHLALGTHQPERCQHPATGQSIREIRADRQSPRGGLCKHGSSSSSHRIDLAITSSHIDASTLPIPSLAKTPAGAWWTSPLSRATHGGPRAVSGPRH